MNIKDIKLAIANKKISWQRHALERMMERNISRASVKKALISGEIIEKYDEDRPYPSSLVLGWVDDKPIHIVIAYDTINNICFIITAYRPNSTHFEPDYKTRKK